MRFEVMQTFLGCKQKYFWNTEGEKIEFFKCVADYPDDIRVAKADKKLFEQLSRNKFPQTVRCFYDAKFDKFFGKE